MTTLLKRMLRKEDPRVYEVKDAHLVRTLRVRDFLSLVVGTIVSTTIFTLPGAVAAEHAGPAVILSFLGAAVVAGLVAFAYAEMASAMPLLVLLILGLMLFLENFLVGLPVGLYWLNILLR